MIYDTHTHTHARTHKRTRTRTDTDSSRARSMDTSSVAASPRLVGNDVGRNLINGFAILPAPQLTHAAAPASEYVPAQHRHASVDRHEPPLPLGVIDQLPSAATRHAPILHLSSAPHCAAHTLLGQ